MSKDSIGKVLFVAVSLCVVCSVIVSALAVGLRDRQEINKQLDKRRNVLIAAAIIGPDDDVDVQELFKSIDACVVNLATGEIASDIDPATFEQRVAAKDPERSIEIPTKEDLGHIKRRSKFAEAFIQRENGKLSCVVLPFHGKGLWSTMYGFVALESDLKTVRGLVFYQQGETAGLGGEVENPIWRGQWPGKVMYKDGEYKFDVLKGAVLPNDPAAQHKADGISGATITVRGVDAMLRYWLGDSGFKPFLDKLAKKEPNDG
ncbi:MAG: Na(+)-translocating NADH-quinone reductase subunit C [Planctomycetota bacterium]